MRNNKVRAVVNAARTLLGLAPTADDTAARQRLMVAVEHLDPPTPVVCVHGRTIAQQCDACRDAVERWNI